jgi:hypothetical protein
MRYSDLAQRLVAREVRGNEQHLEVHHIVDDHLEVVWVRRVPATRAADDGAEACGECSGKRLDGL